MTFHEGKFYKGADDLVVRCLQAGKETSIFEGPEGKTAIVHHDSPYAHSLRETTPQ